METFFFISLGITFILILLLVYHFKQRLTVVEDKGDTMFEIMNNMVKEMGVIKTMAMRSMQYQGPFANIQQSQPQMPPPPAPVQEPFREFQPTNEIIQSISEDDEDDDEEEEDEEDEDDDEEEDAKERVEDEDEEDAKERVEEDEDEEDDDGTIASEEIDMGLTEDVNQTLIEIELTENITKKIVVSEDDPLLDTVELEEIAELPLEEVAELPLEEVAVLPLEEVTVLPLEEVTQPSEPAIEPTADDYRKMTLGELKQAVVTKGLATDATKLKKRDLLELLCVAK